MSLDIGNPIPDFEFFATNNLTARLSNFCNQYVVLYFYPKDATPGCTTEAEQFRDLYDQFQIYNCILFGISRDSLTSHERFKNKHLLPFDLISDTSETLCKQFSVMKDKNMYGSIVRGIERSTFLIDKSGLLIHAWRGVKIIGHAEDVLTAIIEHTKQNEQSAV